MFFTTKTGVNVIQFGSGDIEVGAGEYPEENVACVSIIPLVERIPPNTDIDHTEDYKKGKTDEDLGVHTRLLFTCEESIDALIWALEEAKKDLNNQN